MGRLVLGSVLIAAACGHTRDTAVAPEREAIADAPTRPAAVHDLVWSGEHYDARHVQKERFLEPLRLCWAKVTEHSPTSAGVARIDLTIDAQGGVVEATARAILFHDAFMGEEDSEGETIFTGCAHNQFNKLPVAPAKADRGTLSIDVRLVPAHRPPGFAS